MSGSSSAGSTRQLVKSVETRSEHEDSLGKSLQDLHLRTGVYTSEGILSTRGFGWVSSAGKAGALRGLPPRRPPRPPTLLGSPSRRPRRSRPEWRNGRRRGLKIPRGHTRAGSNPASGTIHGSDRSTTWHQLRVWNLDDHPDEARIRAARKGHRVEVLRRPRRLLRSTPTTTTSRSEPPAPGRPAAGRLRRFLATTPGFGTATSAVVRCSPRLEAIP